MREFRLFQPAALAPGMTLALDEAGHHHFSRVLRRRVGDEVCLFNGDGRDYAARIVHMERRQTMVEITQVSDNERESALDLVLCLAWLKPDAMDRSVQKAVELGVTAIYPMLCARSEAEKSSQDKKMAHWQGIVASAAAQCGRAVLPVLHAPQPFAAVLEAVQAPMRWIASPWHDSNRPAVAHTQALAVAIGPEGGFMDAEVAQAAEAGWQSVLLGRRILRADTAVITALARAQWLYGDLREEGR